MVSISNDSLLANAREKRELARATIMPDVALDGYG